MMSILNEHSTRDDVLKVIRKGEVRDFAEIPECFQIPEMAIRYIQYSCIYPDVNDEFKYSTVPKHCRTDAFLMEAASMGLRVLKDTFPEDTGIYRDLAVVTIGSGFGFKDVLPEFRDEEMVEGIIKRYSGNIHSLIGRVDWLIEAMSDGQLDRCCHNEFMVALDAPAHRIKGCVSQYLKLDKLTGHEIVYIRRHGRLDLIARKLKEEKWPFPLFGEGGERMPIEPESIEKLLERLEKSDPDTPYETIYMACMMREPIAQVVPLMASNRFKKLLLEMYSKEALAPFLKTDAGLRGVLLEEAMGL
jgi:hypothetical protein